MTDPEIIQQAYENAVKLVFVQLCDNVLRAKTEAELEEARRRFRTGLGAARKSREEAVRMVQEQLA